MKELKNIDDLSRNLGVSGNGEHHELLDKAVNLTGFSKSKLVQMLLEGYLEILIDEIKARIIREEKNEQYFRNCEAQRRRKSA
jgi:hypothetical protein